MNSTVLRKSLHETFPAEQATLLADTFTDAFSSQERVAAEMGDIRREVQRLAAAQERLAEAQARTEQAQARTERSVQDLARQVGGLSDKLGGSLEDLAIETVPAVLSEEWGIAAADCGREVFAIDGQETEVDLVLRGAWPDGREVLVLGEVKARLTPREVAQHLARVERLRPLLGGYDLRVLFFGFQIGLEARKLVREAGAWFLFSNGRFLKVT
jgi:hypothetical protein